MPPVEEQRAIADYLDRETARIDTLIDEQQRLIEMLRERRKAVIEQAVFSGLEGGRTSSNAEAVASSDTVLTGGSCNSGSCVNTVVWLCLPQRRVAAPTKITSRLLRGVNVQSPGRDQLDRHRLLGC